MRERYESLILNHPALVMVAAVVATVFFAYMLRGLSFSSSTDKFFVAGAPEKVDFERAKDYFGSD